MRHRHTLPLLVLILGLALLSLNCPKKPVETAPEPPPEAVEQPPVPKPPEPERREVPPEPFPTQDVEKAPAPAPDIAALNRSGVLGTIYFAFDRYDLDELARSTLQRNARWLQDNSARTILVEGHCDERGTIEYNLALGERRASAVRDYLVSLGVDASRIRIVSYGEEQPADPGHNEGAWAKNRRAQFLIES